MDPGPAESGLAESASDSEPSTTDSSDNDSDSQIESEGSSDLSFKATLGAVKFFGVKIPEPQWRILINGESKTGKNGQKTIALVKQYRKRVEAVEAFWGLSPEDRSDLDR